MELSRVVGKACAQVRCTAVSDNMGFLLAHALVSLQEGWLLVLHVNLT